MKIDDNIVDDLKNLNREDVQFIKKCSAIAHDISTRRFTILDLIEKLGDLLVSQSVVERELGTWILTNILEKLPPDHLDERQLNYICNFYIDKFRDTHQLIPSVLQGIHSIIKYDHFPSGGAKQILVTLFQHVPCQQQQQADRLLIYKFLEVSLEKQKDDLLAMGLDYVYGIISAVDGERDPKNLIFLLTWFPNFLKVVNFGHLTEEMFEVLACYFPVDFRAPPQDPDAITRETLADALCQCLCAIPQFAQYCIPLALEKLDSSLNIAKLDSLKLLEHGCSTFESVSFLQHGTEIWSVIQKELLNIPPVELQHAYLECLSSIIKKISENEGVKSILKNICDTLKGNLLPDSKLFELSSTFLLHISGSSAVSAKFVTQEIVPILTNTYNITKTEKHKVQILSLLVRFAHTYAQFYDTVETENLASIPVHCVKASIATSDEMKKAGFDGLRELSQYLSVQIRLQTYQNLRYLLVTPEKERASILACFQKLAQNYSDEVKEKLIDVLDGSNFPSMYLESLSKIAHQEHFLDFVLDTLLIHIQQNTQAACVNLKLLLEENENNAEIHKGLYERNLVNKLLALNVTEEEVLRNVSAVLKALIGYQSSDKQQKIVDEALPTILNDEKNTDVAFVHLLDGILSRIRRNVCINGVVLKRLTGLLMRSEDVASKEVAVQLMSNLLNKCQDESLLEEYLGEIEATTSTKSDVMVMAWVCKALVMRNHRLASDWTNKLIQMLEVNPDVAHGFRIIMKDDLDTLSAKSYCITTLLFKQRFFTIVSNALVENYKPGFPSYLEALGYLMEFAPKQAVVLEFKKLLKLIILCLEQCPDPNVLRVLLRIFNDLISTRQHCVEDHLDEFLTRILKLCSEHESMKVRVLALQCMQNFAQSFPVYKLLPHKQTVISSLGRCVDDKKRIVRKEAVEARSLWFLLDAPM